MKLEPRKSSNAMLIGFVRRVGLCGSCVRVLPSVICREALDLDRRCISDFGTGATPVRSTEWFNKYLNFLHTMLMLPSMAEFTEKAWKW